MKYWLCNSDPDLMVYHNSYNFHLTVYINPLYTLNNQVCFHCSYGIQPYPILYSQVPLTAPRHFREASPPRGRNLSHDAIYETGILKTYISHPPSNWPGGVVHPIL